MNDTVQTTAVRPTLEVRHLIKHFAVRQDVFASLLREPLKVHAVDDVSFTVGREETFGLVGESGSGKSTIGKLIARLIEPTGGTMLLDGEDWLALRGAALRRARRNVQMIFQNPYASLDPRWTVESIVAEPLSTHKVVPRGDVHGRVAELLRAVGLEPSHAQRFPHQFSGGQRQRIGLARALALNPRLLIADEPVSALDVSVQAQILNLIQDIQERYHLSLLFISHDLSVVKYVCDRVAVMYLGRVVEVAGTRALFRRPLHPYTQALLAAIPEPTTKRRRIFAAIEGEIPSPIHPPSGCRFHPRCARARALCALETPEFRELAPGHWAACHYAEA
ncbi:MAG: ATP-binding cassette domain-containing protein [Alphaproteobacteria bacterium]|nr:ATP-binding cassette domain-containing protein [Alphaproteobacteria bacterium]